MEVPIEAFATLIEQTTFLLSQASLSISYARHLNILKTLLKDPRKVKTLLKEKTALEKYPLSKRPSTVPK